MSLLSIQREWKRSFSGVATEVRSARTWMLTHTRLIDIGSGLAERAAFLLSELASNAIVHTVSGREGGMFQVTLRIESTIIRAEVTDQGNSHSFPV
ncbi:histidine kinase-like protein [Haloactinospora alba]|uniref:Histidine kinase-like protein n=1 Tax=Haloactinospora alba TaxID=405555 RepID=A0A543NEL4_9ACTN|nr:ATP-binding protein [Haloactinospora alba]TQN30272.1 histidine kinase-like protein [Haloactinospora alba]